MTNKVLIASGWFWLAVAAVHGQAVKAAGQAPSGSDSAPGAVAAERVVTELLSGYSQAINERDIAKVTGFFTDDSVLLDLDGNVTEGRSMIGEQFARGFSEASDFRLETSPESVRALAPDVIQVEGLAKLTAPSESSIVTRFTALVVRQSNAWRFAEIRDLPAPPEDVAPYERLRELEWMVGDWVDQSTDATVKSSVRWGENRAYLVRRSTAQVGDEPASSSLMIVAWDPRTEQIRSWLFNSEGGLGEAIWTRSADDQWIVKAEGTLRDGSPNSATQMVTLQGPDSVKTSSLDRIIGGEVAPDIEEVVMVRQPPAPSETSRGD